jgi:hypothetical protein
MGDDEDPEANVSHTTAIGEKRVAVSGVKDRVSAGTGPRAETPAGSAWVRGPAWDSFWILNALWLGPLALWLARGHADSDSSALDMLFFVMSALFWVGHRLGSTWIAYGTEAYRPLLRAQPVRFVVLPLLVAAGCFGLFLPPDVAFPWTRAQRVVGVAVLDYALVTYHFAAQHFGALSLYRGRIGRGSSTSARRLDRVFALGVGGVLVFLADILAGAVSYQKVWVGHWLVPASIASIDGEIRRGGTLVLLVLTAAMLFAEVRAPRRSLPRVLYVIGVAAMVAVALRPRSAFLFVVIWNSQHWILATGLGSQTPSLEPAPERGPVRRARHLLNSRPWAVLLLLIGASVLLLPIFEVEANMGIGSSARLPRDCAHPHGCRLSWPSAFRRVLSTISSIGASTGCGTRWSAQRRAGCCAPPVPNKAQSTIHRGRTVPVEMLAEERRARRRSREPSARIVETRALVKVSLLRRWTMPAAAPKPVRERPVNPEPISVPLGRVSGPDRTSRNRSSP